MNTVLTDSTAVVNTPSDLDLDTKRAVGSFMTHLADAKLPAISRVLLYGSRARGDYQADSDVDIAGYTRLIYWSIHEATTLTYSIDEF